MRIAFAVSPGGHLTEAEAIFTQELLGKRKFIYITEKNRKTEKMPDTYFVKSLGYNPWSYIPALIKCLLVLRKERINVVVTTGAEIALPALVAGKILGLKTIFIETITRLKTPTLAGKFSYPFSDIFLVQNPGIEKKYGSKAKYEGGII